MEQLMGIIQRYQEKNNATLGMMPEMKKMFEEKFNDLEKENNLLKEQFFKDKTEHEQDEETQANKSKKEEEGDKHKMNKKEIEFTENSEESSSRAVHTRKTSRHSRKSTVKGGNEKKKIDNNEEPSKRLIRELARKIGKGINSPID